MTYAENFETAERDMKSAAIRHGGTWVVVEHPTVIGKYGRGMKGSVSGKVVSEFTAPDLTPLCEKVYVGVCQIFARY